MGESSADVRRLRSAGLFSTAPGNPIVAAITNAAGECPVGTFKQTNGSPMIHVRISSHPCGPFAAVEGVAGGTAAVPDAQRLDLCNAAH